MNGFVRALRVATSGCLKKQPKVPRPREFIGFMGRRTEFGVVLGGEVQAEVAGGVGVKPFLPELSQAATAVDAA